jgi:isopentenyl-diphosphate delta-isomerase
MKEQQVILVNENDEPLGQTEKMDAHRKGLLHRAFSVFIFDSKGRMLLQQRAPGKYHGGLLWTNACCSHPQPGETVEQAADRRLEEELGIRMPLEKIFSFTYRENVENGLVEHEFDHVFAGEYSGMIYPNPHEVSDYRFEEMQQIRSELEQQPEKFTSWFRLAFPRVEEWYKKAKGF